MDAENPFFANSANKIGSGDLGQFSDRASYSDRLMFSCMRRRTRYESHTTLSAPLRSLVPFSSLSSHHGLHHGTRQIH